MGDLNNISHVLILLLNLGTLLTSIAYSLSAAPKQAPQVPKPRLSPSPTVQPPCPPPSSPPKPPPTAPKRPPPSPPIQAPCPPPPSPPKPPIVHPPITPKPPNHPKPPPSSPPTAPKRPPQVPEFRPPPPSPPKPPVVKTPPYIPKMPPPKTPHTPLPPSPPPPKKQDTCPIDTLKLGMCVDYYKTGIGPSATATCCPVLEGLMDWDAALCLCSTIQDKHLDVNVFMPYGLQLLAGCGKNPPSGFQCPA